MKMDKLVAHLESLNGTLDKCAVEIKKLRDERDALATQNTQLVSQVWRLQNGKLNGDEYQAFLQTELSRQVRADAGRDGFIAGYNECWRQVFGTNVPEYATGYSADQYADSIRKESEK